MDLQRQSSGWLLHGLRDGALFEARFDRVIWATAPGPAVTAQAIDARLRETLAPLAQHAFIGGFETVLHSAGVAALVAGFLRDGRFPG